MFSEVNALKPLESGSAHLWFAATHSFAENPSVRKMCEANLCEEERSVAHGMPDQNSQFEYMLSHAMLRSALSLYSNDVEPWQWRFTKNAAGKPVLDQAHADSQLNFNVSTSPGMVACAVSRGLQLGVDIEHHASWGAPLADANHYFSELELASLSQRPAAERDRLFYRYWTLKESWIKACGVGQAVKLDSFSFGMGASGRIHFVPPGEDTEERKRWEFRVFNPSEDYTIALTAQAPLNDFKALKLESPNKYEELRLDELSSDFNSYASGRSVS